MDAKPIKTWQTRVESDQTRSNKAKVPKLCVKKGGEPVKPYNIVGNPTTKIETRFTRKKPVKSDSNSVKPGNSSGENTNQTIHLRR